MYVLSKTHTSHWNVWWSTQPPITWHFQAFKSKVLTLGRGDLMSPFWEVFVGEIVTSKALYEMCPNKVHCTPHVNVTQGAACRQFLGAMVGGAGGCFVGGWLCIPAGLCYISVWKFELVTRLLYQKNLWEHVGITLGVTLGFPTLNPATFAFLLGLEMMVAFLHMLIIPFWPSICIIPCMSWLG